jgi:serine/threonine protein kinase/Tol biopolymer transport system component
MLGQVVGHYRILEKIGVGAMGEVFRARDERLGREVALKIIRPSSGGNADHLRRFEQEARAAAALNHPNIVAIYDVGSAADSPYIVSELLQGKTVRERLTEGPISVTQATDFALQIARGLIAAHDRRIVHRDLKPENLFLTQDGRMKILDFGVAKLQPETGSELSAEAATTVTKSGMVVGTVAYMSPEQLRGKAVDHRSDIFSAGAIFYELVAGRRAFRGETEVDTMTAILREEPPEIEPHEGSVPQSLRDIIRHCLEKEPENRFQSPRDLAFALETLSGASTASGVRHVLSRRRSAAVPWAVAVLLVIALGLVGTQVRRQSPQLSYRRLTFEQGTLYAARYAPDGQSIVYAAAWNGRSPQVYSTVGNSMLAQPLGITDAGLLSISRSNELALVLRGSHLGHLETVNGMLARAPLAGGSPRELLADVRWADWDAKGELAVVHHEEGRSRLEYPPGHVLYETGGWISHIRFSREGDWIAFLDHPALWDDRGSVDVTDLSGHVRVLSSGWEAEDGLAWSPDGKEVWFTAAKRGNSRDLVAVDLSGKVRVLLDFPGALTLQDVASDGSALISADDERMALAWGSRKSKNITDLSWHNWNIAKDLSSDEQWVLFEDGSEEAGVHYSVAIRKLDGTPPIRLGEGSAGGLSPDGKWAISIVNGDTDQVMLLPVGAGQPRSVSTGGLQHVLNGPARFLPDGQRIFVNGNEPGHGVRCYVLDLAGGRVKPITPEGVAGQIVSPDGRYILGAITPSRAASIYPIEGGSPRPIPGLEPDFALVRWTGDGSALYGYRTGHVPTTVYKVDPATGRKTPVQELLADAPAGVVNVQPLVMNGDASRFVYSYYQISSVLYLVSGLK